MKRYTQRAWLFLIAACIAPLIVSACAQAINTTIDDPAITMRVKTALLNDPDIAIARIDVATFKGVVTLSGRVKSKDEEERAIAIARKINGVTDVKSNLQIGPGKQSTNW